MRRSLAPSQIHVKKPEKEQKCTNHRKQVDNEDAVTICRLPLFGFLEIPEVLNKKFKVPSGCILTEQSIALRKIKSLGPNRSINILRPGQGLGFIKPLPYQESSVDSEENEEEGLPKANLPVFEPLVLWADPNDDTNKIEVIPELACKLRPHQREGVQFLFECTMGLRGFEGQGCILADDMGLGKTLMSITLMWTLINQGMVKGQSAVTKVMIVCPTSLVGNWDNEIRKWVGDRCPTFAVKTEPKKMIKSFVQHRGKAVLIVSYETQRLYSKLFENNTPAKFQSAMSTSVCDLLICDEAHKLKNAESGLAKSLNLLPARKRILLSGTPMQNELTEFYNMVNFCNPLIIGTIAEFKKRYERPILASREPEALDSEVAHANALQKELSTIVNEFILKRGNILNAQHLPPKLVQFVCCRLTPLQESMYECLINSKEVRHVREGKQTNTLNSIRQMINICSHPKIILDGYNAKLANKEPIDADLQALADIVMKHNAANPHNNSNGGSSSSGAGGGVKSKFGGLGLSNNRLNLSTRGGFGTSSHVSSAPPSGGHCDPEQSGKMIALFRMIQTMKAVKQGERIVVVSNYTQTLDLIEGMCAQNNWHTLRLDGTVSANKRTKLVDEFNNPTSQAFVFLLSSKAGGCGINLIGGSRLVLFDPDWNPASDKQAAARIWREGQKRRCFIYRFMSTGTIEEKIIQRQLSKEGLADIVDNKDQVNVFSSDELRQLFELRSRDTNSDTHDTLRCKRCSSVRALDYRKEKKSLGPAQVEACVKFLGDFAKYLETEASLHRKKEQRRLAESGGTLPEHLLSPPNNTASQSASLLPFSGLISELQSQLQNNEFATLPLYSRRQREVMLSIDTQLSEARKSAASTASVKPVAAVEGDSGIAAEVSVADSLIAAEEEEERRLMEVCRHLFPSTFSLYSEFLNQWSETVPTLTLLNSSNSGNGSSGSNSSSNLASAAADSTTGSVRTEDDAANTSAVTVSDEGFVEQEGCPEESDFNKWSHHCAVATCDDELLQRSLGDDSVISFVFGLEVNWSLLLAREELTREESEARKEQQRLDLEALNAQRQKKKRRDNGEEEEDVDVSEETVAATEGDAQVLSPGGKKKGRPKKDQSAVEGKQAKRDGKKTPSSAAKSKSKVREVVLLSDNDEDSVQDCDSDEEGAAETREPTTRNKANRKITEIGDSYAPAAAVSEAEVALRNAVEAHTSEVDLWGCDDDNDYSFAYATEAAATASFGGCDGMVAADGVVNSSVTSGSKRSSRVLDDDEDIPCSGSSSGSGGRSGARKGRRVVQSDSDSDDVVAPSQHREVVKPSAAVSAPMSAVKVSRAATAGSPVLIDITNTQQQPVVTSKTKQTKEKQQLQRNAVSDLESPPAAESTTWSCASCTYINNVALNPLHCDMCEVKRVRVSIATLKTTTDTANKRRRGIVDDD